METNAKKSEGEALLLLVRRSGLSGKSENEKARLRVLKKERRSLRQLRRIVRLFLA